MKRHGIFRNILSDNKPQRQGSIKRLNFSGNKENVTTNGETLLEERVSLFDGRTNPIRCFSVDDLNSMNVDKDGINMGHHQSHRGVWEGMLVLVKIFSGAKISSVCREIAVATQMGTHRNVHRLLGCCLGTKYPVLVYQWEDNGTLNDRIFKYKEQSKEPLEWKERLRIAWEIAHAVAYLHTAFRRPIIHKDLKPHIIYLDKDDSAKLSDFSSSISIPKGEMHFQDTEVTGTAGFLAHDYLFSGRVAESTDVFAFGVLLLVLLSGKPAFFTSRSDHGVNLVDWVKGCLAANSGDIVDPALTTNGHVNENLRPHLVTLLKISLDCTDENEECRPTMVDVATQLKNIVLSLSDTEAADIKWSNTLSDYNPKHPQGSNKHLIFFTGNEEYFFKNGETLQEERICLFDGGASPICFFSVDDLNSMNVEEDGIDAGHYRIHRGVWNEKLVLVKIFCNDENSSACREIAVATQLSTHRNVHRLLGCCLGTINPVLVYQWEENGTLDDRIFNFKEQNKEPLEWKDRLRIAWEIAHAVAYLHTAFNKPIIHRTLKGSNVLLDEDHSARLSDFSFCISIPVGEKHVEDKIIGTYGYIAPDYMNTGMIAQSTDVYAFGVLLFVLLTGKRAVFTSGSDHGMIVLVDWVNDCLQANCDIVDPAITTNDLVDEHLTRQLSAWLKLALSCTDENKKRRPTMVCVKNQLENMFTSSSEF